MVPNPAKIVIILEELQIPYKAVYVELTELKELEYESVNPNGRVPGNLTLYL
jgi:glutathione S-transferase